VVDALVVLVAIGLALGAALLGVGLSMGRVRGATQRVMLRDACVVHRRRMGTAEVEVGPFALDLVVCAAPFPGLAIGDPVFDHVVSVSGDEVQIRAALDADTRAALQDLVVAGAELSNGWLRFERKIRGRRAFGATDADGEVEDPMVSLAVEVVRAFRGATVADLPTRARFDPQSGVRVEAVSVLVRQGQPGGRELEAELLTEGPAAVRVALASRRGAVEVLREIARDPDVEPPIRRTAFFATRAADWEQGMLLSMLADAPVWDLAVTALADIGDQDCLDALRQVEPTAPGAHQRLVRAARRAVLGRSEGGTLSLVGSGRGELALVTGAGALSEADSD
jgi:F0F1-type ATP synthase membrane subunit c/vacuolar-type H+-ATPase subunit K